MVFQSLQNGVIDLAIGEPRVVWESLPVLSSAAEELSLPTGELFARYPDFSGMPKLIQKLQEFHWTDSPIVITNGATQGLHAALFAARQKWKYLSHPAITVPIPYWPFVPDMISRSGFQAYYPRFWNSLVAMGRSHAYLITSPNNPDGKTYIRDEVRFFREQVHHGAVVIHDAAYLSNIYTYVQHTKPFGSLQVHSFAKSFGVPGQRVGYVICDDKSLAADVAQYVERDTSGVSSFMQLSAAMLIQAALSHPEKLLAFRKAASAAIMNNRLAFTKVSKKVLGADQSYGTKTMFGWHKAGPLLDLEKARVSLLDGYHCGVNGFMRVNYGASHENVLEAVKRLNALVPSRRRKSG